MPFNYKKVLVVGATSGIGEALAEEMVSEGVFVIVVGRRKERLDAFVQKHGSDKAEAATLDITKLGEVPQFAANIISAHPDLDSVFLNSGIQRSFDFSKPESVDLSVLEEEFQTNYISYMHLLKAFLPHLQKQQKETSVIFTTSGLALVPMLRCPNYCASKAALHHFILTLREQLKRGPGNVKVIECIPPAVQTELHDAKHQPDLKDGAKIGMPLDEYTKLTWMGLKAGEDQIPVGGAKSAYVLFESERQQLFARLNAKV